MRGWRKLIITMACIFTMLCFGHVVKAADATIYGLSSGYTTYISIPDTIA